MGLIDADKLERQEYWGNERCFDYVDADDIDNAPTVDAVPVVRCKDCKHEFGGSCIICGFQKRKPDDFCSYGERKDGGERDG